MILKFSIAVALASLGLLMHRRLLRYLQIYQQDEYDSARFTHWLIKTRTFDRWVSAALIPVITLQLLWGSGAPAWILNFVCAAIFSVFALREPDPRRQGKKPLSMTKRANYIIIVALALVLIAAFLVLSVAPWLGWLIVIQFGPVFLIIANYLLKPIESRAQAYYWNDARARLQQIDPLVVGVTGSFGKTSVKHILGHALSLNTRAFVTPGSVNTPMGIARVIRETLPIDTKIFVVEMGAYGAGSINALCKLTPPQMGIITAVGAAHYERFKTLDTVVRSKFELAAAVLQSSGGQMIIHDSVLEQPFAHQFVSTHRSRVTLCGANSDSDFIVGSTEYKANGLIVTIKWNNTDYRLEVPLHGAQQVGNIALVFAAAVKLGIAPERITAALRTTPQVKHRLEVKTLPNGSIYIDDAYNSNPIGFAAGLKLLSQLSRTGSRRILVTPGMVELGAEHDSQHKRLGEIAGEHVDIAIVVKPKRIPTFIQGYLTKRANNSLLEFETFDEASAWLRINVSGNDIVLVENDLPDLYERRLKI